jgi:signal transduction histidine kinase
MYVLLINITVYYIDHMRVDADRYKAQISNTAEDFQNYITENKVSIKDIKAIKFWDKKQNLMHIKLVQNNRVIYDSLDYITSIVPKVSYIYYEPTNDFFNSIEFFDGQATLCITILYKQRLEQKVDYVVGIICILLFVVVILNDFKKLVKDILEIKKGIQILEGGNLSFDIQSKRKDEISELAESIKRMSKELYLQRKEDENLLKKNYDLVTSISHDLRTPLTIVNSYIDLIMEKKYADTMELNRYLEKIKGKSILINDLTDNLFTHFLNKNTDYKYNYEIVIGNDFIKFLLHGMEEGLRDKGYQVMIDNNLDEEFFLKIDVVQIQRVFNNLEGNLLKYCLKSKPIIYSAGLIDNVLVIKGQNVILNNNNLDSHGVGIINCQEIIKHHLGELKTFIENNNYHVTLSIPAYLFNTNNT